VLENTACQSYRDEALRLSEDLAARLKEERVLFSKRISDQEREISYLQSECSSRDAKIRLLNEACDEKDEQIARRRSQVYIYP
jgi:hypothetical protein